MGQALSAPVTTKRVQSGEDERCLFAVADMQGWRLSMEDAHCVLLDLDRDELPGEPNGSPNGTPAIGSQANPTPCRLKTSLFCVFDGHGGSSVARYSAQTIHLRLREALAGLPPQISSKDYNRALKQIYLKTDDALRKDPQFFNDLSGCTAITAVLTPQNYLYVANAGDSRAVLCRNGTAVNLSLDHKPTNVKEYRRISSAGGFVECGRVNGNLALSRAIGDFEYKRNALIPPKYQIVTANPQVAHVKLAATDEFAILACDGIWDVIGSQTAIDFIRRGIAEQQDLSQISKRLMDHCLAPDMEWSGVGCDNMTVLIIALLGGRSKEEWYGEIRRRVADKEGHLTPWQFNGPFSPDRRTEINNQYRNFSVGWELGASPMSQPSGPRRPEGDAQSGYLPMLFNSDSEQEDSEEEADFPEADMGESMPKETGKGDVDGDAEPKEPTSPDSHVAEPGHPPETPEQTTTAPQPTADAGPVSVPGDPQGKPGGRNDKRHKKGRGR